MRWPWSFAAKHDPTETPFAKAMCERNFDIREWAWNDEHEAWLRKGFSYAPLPGLGFDPARYEHDA